MLKKIIDLKLIKYLAIYYAIIALIGGAKKSFYKIKGYYSDTYTWFDMWVYDVLFDWFAVMIFMIFVAYITKKMQVSNMNLKLVFLIHFLLSLILSFFIFISASFFVFLILGDITRVARNTTFRHFMLYIDINFLIYFSMLSIIYGYYYIKKIHASETQKTKLQTQLVSTKMNILRAQLHPHFVFNTLNSISSLIVIDKNKAQFLITAFSDLFKGVLEIKNGYFIPLHKELNLLDKFIDIISARFSDHILIQKNIEANLESVQIPNMLLQPLLENTIKHGYSYEKTELSIKLSINKSTNYLIILIENDGKLLKDKFSKLLKKGIGLKNTYERLFTLYGDDFEFNIRNNITKSGVEAFIKIPISHPIQEN